MTTFYETNFISLTFLGTGILQIVIVEVVAGKRDEIKSGKNSFQLGEIKKNWNGAERKRRRIQFLTSEVSVEIRLDEVYD